MADVKATATVTLSIYRDTESVTRYYKLQTSSLAAPSKPTTNPPSSDWVKAEPACDTTKTLYFCDISVFSDGKWSASEVSKSSSYEASKEAYNKAQSAQDSANNVKDQIVSMGEQLVINGNGLMGDNTNFSALIFDASKANGSPGSFTRKGTLYKFSVSDTYIPIIPNLRYSFEMDAISKNGLIRMYSFLLFYDVDKKDILANHHMYIENTLTYLTQDLKNGDTVVYLNDLSAWNDTFTQGYRRGFIFWNYTNSFGYTYPELTYSRNMWDNIYENSNVDKTNNTITLSSPWSHGTFKAGTKLSQSDSGKTYKYQGMDYSRIPTEWRHYSGFYDGIDYSGKNVLTKFPPGAACAKVGFIWNYDKVDDQCWITNISLKTDDVIVGGRNLIRDSDRAIATNAELVGRYALSQYVEIGTTYTIRIKGTLKVGTFMVMMDTIYGGLTWPVGGMIDNGDGTYTQTYTIPSSVSGIQHSSPLFLIIHDMPDGAYEEGDDLVTIEWVKLEKGNKATDWTPAPEDVDESISNAQKTATDFISPQTTTLSDDGIKVFPKAEKNNPKNYALINQNGVDLYQNTSRVASFGSTTIIGNVANRNILIDSDSVDIRSGTTVLASFGKDTTTIGTITGATIKGGKIEGTELTAITGKIGPFEILPEGLVADDSQSVYTASLKSYGLFLYNSSGAEVSHYGNYCKVGSVFTDNLSATNKVTISGNGLNVSDGGATISDGLTVSGGATISDGLTVSGGATISDGLTVSGGDICIDNSRFLSSYTKTGSTGTLIGRNEHNTMLIGEYGNTLYIRFYADSTLVAQCIYDGTVSNGSNVRVLSDGKLYRYGSSSIRYKEHIKIVRDEDLNPENLYNLNVWQYKYRDGYLVEGDPRTNATHVGFLAEEVKQYYPIAVEYTDDGYAENWDERYIIPPMLKLIQDQHKDIELLKQQVNSLMEGANYERETN